MDVDKLRANEAIYTFSCTLNTLNIDIALYKKHIMAILTRKQSVNIQSFMAVVTRKLNKKKLKMLLIYNIY